MGLDDIRNEFQDSRYVLATFGSDTEHEQDVLVIDRTSSGQSIRDSTHEFTQRFSRVSPPENCEIIVCHNHRAYITPPNYALHLLFYPSFDHLIAWELPSFLSYLFLNAKIEQGSLENIESIATAYSRQETSKARNDNLYTKQQYAYDKIAVDSLLYTAQSSEIYPHHVSSEDLCYVTRFTLAEYYLASALQQFNADAWSWQTIIHQTVTHFPEKRKVMEILERGSKHAPFENADILLGHFLAYFTLRDELMSSVNERNPLNDNTC